MTVAVDRAASVRHALRGLVADHGFHGASMAKVAAAAGVATGTAYVHYASKDEVVFSTYLEVKRELGDAAAAAVDPSTGPAERFLQLWRAVHAHLVAEPERARFLVQVEASPFADRAHELAMAVDDDPLMDVASTPDMAALLAPLPFLVLYDLALGPAVRLVARGTRASEAELDELAAACWRAVTSSP